MKQFLFYFLFHLTIAANAQSHIFQIDFTSAVKDSTIKALEDEVKNLTTLQESLRAELASLNLLAQSMPAYHNSSTYSLRLEDNVILELDPNLVLVPSFENRKYIYTISGFSDPHQAYALAQRLRALNLKKVSVVESNSAKHVQPLLPDTKIKSVRIGSLIIEE